jgi:hypothetical protein
MSHEFSVEGGPIVFSRDGRAQFGWLDPEAGAYYGEADGRCISDAISAIGFHCDAKH